MVAVVGLQDPGLYSRQTYFECLEEMAGFYKKSIQYYQKNGPYYIAGASYGATLSIEIAQQFRREGEVVKFIGLLDGCLC